MNTTLRIGKAGESVVAYSIEFLGGVVYLGPAGSMHDMLVDYGGKFHSVQVKATSGDVLQSWHSNHEHDILAMVDLTDGTSPRIAFSPMQGVAGGTRVELPRRLFLPPASPEGLFSFPWAIQQSALEHADRSIGLTYVHPKGGANVISVAGKDRSQRLSERFEGVATFVPLAGFDKLAGAFEGVQRA